MNNSGLNGTNCCLQQLEQEGKKYEDYEKQSIYAEIELSGSAKMDLL